MRRGRGLVVAAAFAVVALPASGHAATSPIGVDGAVEAPLDDLVGYPPGHHESRRMPIGNAEFYVQQAGVQPGEVVEGVTITAGRATDPVMVVRGTRFVSAEAAEAAGVTLTNRGIGRVRDLGSLGAGWIVTLPSDVEDASGSYVHDGFRVRGRDVFSFATMTFDDAAVPTNLLEHMAWHAEMFPGGSQLPVGPDGRAGRTRMVVPAGGAVVAVVAASVVVVRRRRRPPVPPPSGTVWSATQV